MGLVVLWHVESFWIRNGTCVLCIGKKILNHWINREVFFLKKTNFINLFMAASGLCCSMQNLLLQQASFSLVVAHRLGSCSLRPYLLQGVWDLSFQWWFAY